MAAPAAPHVAALQAAGFAMQSDLVPLATTANVNTQFAAMQGQIHLLQQQVNALPSLAQIQVAIQAAIATALVPHNAPAIAAAASATVQAIANARMVNNHYRSGVAYTVVPCADGTPPLNWPAGFDRATLRTGPIAVITALLNDYRLIVPAATFDRRNLLALHIGTADL